MRTKLLPLLLLLGISLAGFLVVQSARQRGANEHSELGFPIEIKEERNFESFGGMWTVSVVLDPKHYSKENLDRLFLLFAKKHANRTERLRVTVYTDERNWKAHSAGNPRDWAVPGLPSERDNDRGSRSVYYDAEFSREGDGAMAGGGDNESYSYCPDLSRPEDREIVILKGRLRFRDKTVLETWETVKGTIRVHAIGYEYTDTQPRGIYYTFESPEAGSSYWKSILTSRQETLVPIPRDQVGFIDDKIAYIFMGLMFAVTTDAGKHWSAWDAERDLPEADYVSRYRIRDVHVAADGTGSMTVSHEQSVEQTQRLLTRDHGRHWTKE